MDLHPDFRDLLAEFAAGNVRYVLVGGYAVGHYSKPRATKDLELLVAGDEANLQKVADALRRFGAPPEVIEAARTMRTDEIVYLGAPPVRVDILRRIDGVETEETIQSAESTRVGELEIPVISFRNLIENKRKAARPQDLLDVETLERFGEGEA